MEGPGGDSVLELSHIFAHYFVPAWFTLTHHIEQTPPKQTTSQNRPFLAQIESSEKELRYYHLAMHSLALREGKALSTGVDWTTRKQMLDIGSGTGGLALAILEENPELHAICLDKPEICALGKTLIQGSPSLSRLRFYSVDIYSEQFSIQADAILLSFVCNSSEETKRLLCKCADALTAGGWLIIAEKLPDRTNELHAFSYLNSRVWAGAGFDVHGKSFEDFLEDAHLSKFAEVRTLGFRDFLLFIKSDPSTKFENVI